MTAEPSDASAPHSTAYCLLSTSYCQRQNFYIWRMPFYSDEIIQELKNQADIALVIQQFLPLKKNGINKYVGVCPFHDDHSPSMTVNSTLGIYKCFACGAAGDVFKFIQEHEKLDFKAAVEWVANFVGYTLPNQGGKVNTEALEERTMVQKLNELACEWFEQQLSLSPKALEYLNKRHVSEATRKEFHIGYAPTGREGFIGYAARNGFSPRDCVKAGLAVEKENGGIADKFRDRLMIAIQNLSGVVVAFGGRDLSDPDSHKGIKLAKYMNSPETALYSKRDILFGLNHSRNAITKENAVIIVEGYFDLISLYQSGVQNVVAASGTALTENHASILARYAKTAYLVFDGDAAGQNATRRSLEIVLPKGLSPKVFALSRPDGTKIDPDNFVNEQGPDAFRQALKSAEDWLSYLGRTMPNNSPEDRAAFITQAKTLIKSIENPELRNQYLKLVAERYGTTRSLEGIKNPYHKHAKKATNTEQAAAPQVSVPWELLSPIEVRFANLLYRNPTLFDRACEYFDMDFIASGIQFLDSPLIDEFIQTLLTQYAETGAFSPRIFYESLSPQLQLFLEQLPDETWKTPNEILEFYDTMAVLTENFCNRYKKLIPLDSEAGMRLRMQLNKFTQGIQIVAKKRKISAITPDVFAEQIIQSKTPLIELYTEINELAMNGPQAAQFNNAQPAPSTISQQVPAQSPAQSEMPPEMEAPPPFDGDEQYASSEPPEEAPYDPNEEPYVPDDEPYVPDDDFGAMDDFG